MQPKCLSILGVGLLGGSIGLAVRSVAPDCRVVGYGHRRETLEKAESYGAIDAGYDDAADAVREADLVVLCTPVGIFGEILSKIAPALAEGAVVTDVGSTKRSIVREAERVLPRSVHFVGSHPMAGSEKRGVEFARTDLFHNALCITTPTQRTDPGALEKVESFWRLIGMRITRLTTEEHDRWLADVSHLPHAVAAALVEMQDDSALELAGQGFLDATRIAGGDGGLWRDILVDNRDNMRSAIQKLQENLEGLLAMLEPENSDALQGWLDEAAQRRQNLLQARLRETGAD